MVTNELTYNLSGTIRHLGLPVAGVVVALHESGYGSTAADRRFVSQQKTGARGEFSFPVSAGQYCLEIVPDGQTRFVRQLLTGLAVSANTNINVSLSTGFILSGTVRTGSSGILPDGIVTVIGIDPSGFRLKSNVDASGKFSAILPKGKYYLLSGCAEHVGTDRIVPEGAPYLTSTFEVVEVDSDDEHDIVLADLVHFKGFVTDKSGSPIVGASAAITPSVAWDNPLGPEIARTVRTATDLSGYFELQLQPGDYDLILTPPLNSPLCEMSFCSIALGDEEAKRFELIEGVRLRGKVSFQGASVVGSTVMLRSKDGKLVYSVLSDEGGRFSLAVPAGAYELTVLPKRERRRRHSERIGGPWTRPVVVGGGDTRVDVELGAAVPVVGHVRDGKNSPRSGITVLVCSDRGESPEAEDRQFPLAKYTTDDSGRFKLMLAAGKYWISIAGDPSTAQAVEVKDQPCNLEFIWQGRMLVRFEVAGDDGEPIARCKVSFNPYSKEQLEHSLEQHPGKHELKLSGAVFTGDDGCCEMTLPAGVYTFHFEPLVDGPHEEKEIRQLSIGADVTRKIKLAMKQDANEAQLQLDFSPRAGMD